MLILRKIIKIVAAGCHILKLKCAVPNPISAGAPSLQRPRPLAGFNETTSKGREVAGEKGKVWERRERKMGGKGKAGKGEKAGFHHLSSTLFNLFNLYKAVPFSLWLCLTIH